MERHRRLAGLYALALIGVTVLGWIPAFADANGRLFGIFRLTWYNDVLHLASAAWALIAAVVSASASVTFLTVFGALYLADGLMGLAFGSGYLDLGVVFYGVRALPVGFKVLANGPHIVLGALPWPPVSSGRTVLLPRNSRTAGRRWLRRLVGAFILLGLIVTAPVVTIETACRAPPSTTPAMPPSSGTFDIDDPGYAQPLTNSVLSYPEWYIVYAYQDFAGVLRRGDEHSFGFLASIAAYWSGLCATNRVAAAQGGGALDEKVMLYVIGLSFTAEMTVKGLYEKTLGWLFAVLRGPMKTNEDRLALAVADEYAAFLDQQPWYLYPFWSQVRRLWLETPFDTSSIARALERRLALTAEWGVKAVYGKVLGAAAGLSPAAPRIESVVGGLGEADRTAHPEITVVRDLGGGKLLIDTPRYAAFTRILIDVAERQRPVFEIAGNATIFATVRVPPDVETVVPGLSPIFSDPIQSRPGWRRQGLVLAVPQLVTTIPALKARGVEIEHFYDY